MIDSNKRREAIQALIKNHAIENQQQLVELLWTEYQIETNQSMISRDIREMGIVKKKIKDQLAYELSEVDVTREITRLSVVSIRRNESLIVIKTVGGLASFVGDRIDTHEQDLEILGTVAGENTVFVTPRSTRTITKTYELVCHLLGFKNTSDSDT